MSGPSSPLSPQLDDLGGRAGAGLTMDLIRCAQFSSASAFSSSYS